MRFTISIAIGAGVSLLILLLTAFFPNTPWPFLGAPGYVVVLLFFGPHSPIGVPEMVVPVIALVVTTVVYSLIAYWILGRFKTFKLR